MGASVGTGDGKKSLNVELNIVPFIDLMSCLTAFLLVTAVWVNIARIETKPVGRSNEGPSGDDPPPQLSVLLDDKGVWLGISRINEFQQIPKTASGYDWDAVAKALVAQKKSIYFSDTGDIQVAAESSPSNPIAYKDLVAAMDIAVKSGFVDVGITDPNGLAARPQM